MDLLTKRCGCGRILRQRESCPVCAERRRAEMHARGVCDPLAKHVMGHKAQWERQGGMTVAATGRLDAVDAVRFWASVDQASAEVATWPAWKRGVAEPTAETPVMVPPDLAVFVESCKKLPAKPREASWGTAEWREPPAHVHWHTWVSKNGHIECAECGARGSR